MTSYSLRQHGSTPSNGTSAVQTLTVTGTPTGGTFRLSWRGQRTATIAHNATAATVQTALRALSRIGGSGVTVTGDAGGPWAVTFAGPLAKLEVPLIALAANSLTGGTSPSVSVANTTPGVTATARGAPAGAELIDTSTGKRYANRGSTTSPDWRRQGARSLVARYFPLASMANGDLLTTFTPGFAGKIVKWWAEVVVPATTADKLATLNLEIGTTNLTGGALALTSANCTPMGNVVAASAITAANEFTETDTISIEAASVTAFAEGTVNLVMVLEANTAP
jgi:hypothetical protein